MKSMYDEIREVIFINIDNENYYTTHNILHHDIEKFIKILVINSELSYETDIRIMENKEKEKINMKG
jgi:hypothetical protein